MHFTDDQLTDVRALAGAKDDAGVTRRTALQLLAGIGYAASVVPALASTAIRTPATGLDSGFVTVDVDGFRMPVYRSAPAGKTGMPVILVIQEIFGVHEYIADVTRRLAQQGYMALAPDLFRRQGDPTSYDNTAQLMAELVSKVPDQQVTRDLDAIVDWAGNHGGDASRIGVTGFCWGGRQTWLYATHHPHVRAGVAWYGRLEGQPSPMMPVHPVDVMGKLRAPVLGLYGEADSGIPVDSVNRFRDALESAARAGNKAAATSEFVLYPQAPHAFHADYRPSYREAAAQDGWQRMLTWFRQHGLG